MQVHLSHAFKSKFSLTVTVTSFLWPPLAIWNTVTWNTWHWWQYVTHASHSMARKHFYQDWEGEYEYNGEAETCALNLWLYFLENDPVLHIIPFYHLFESKYDYKLEGLWNWNTNSVWFPTYCLFISCLKNLSCAKLNIYDCPMFRSNLSMSGRSLTCQGWRGGSSAAPSPSTWSPSPASSGVFMSSSTGEKREVAIISLLSTENHWIVILCVWHCF